MLGTDLPSPTPQDVSGGGDYKAVTGYCVICSRLDESSVYSRCLTGAWNAPGIGLVDFADQVYLFAVHALDDRDVGLFG